MNTIEHIPTVCPYCIMTETAMMADVVLPAVSGAEKDGTQTCVDRRVQRVRKAIEPRGQSLPDWYPERRHFPDCLANILTGPCADPPSKMPEFKFSAINIEKVESDGK